MLQLANKKLLLLLGEYVVRYVTTFDEDTGHSAELANDGLINEIEVALFGWVRTIVLESNWHSAAEQMVCHSCKPDRVAQKSPVPLSLETLRAQACLEFAR